MRPTKAERVCMDSPLETLDLVKRAADRRTSCRRDSPPRIEGTHTGPIRPRHRSIDWRLPLGSAPQLFGREPRAFSQCLQLGPHDGRMHLAGGREAGKAAIGTGDHVLAADDVGKAPDALGDRLRMLDEVRAVRDDAGDQRLARRQFDLFPYAPLVLVPRVAGLE